MKNLVLILTILILGNVTFAECNCQGPAKCLDLLTSMYNERATLYNVLNLSSDQQKCKDVIDKKRYDELGAQYRQLEQEKYVLSSMCEHKASQQAIKKQKIVVKNIEKNMKKTGDKYDKEFKTVLNSEQRSKLRSIRKMQKKEIRYCEHNKAFYKKDPNLRTFGEKMYTGEDTKLCPVHNKWHMFGFKHKK